MRLYITDMPLNFVFIKSWAALVESDMRRVQTADALRVIRKTRVSMVIESDTIDQALETYGRKHGALRYVAFMRDGKMILPYLKNLAPYGVLLSCAVLHARTGVHCMAQLFAREGGSGPRFSNGFFTRDTWVRKPFSNRDSSTMASAYVACTYIARYLPSADTVALFDELARLPRLGVPTSEEWGNSEVSASTCLSIFTKPTLGETLMDDLSCKVAKELCRTLRAAGYMRSYTDGAHITVEPYSSRTFIIVSAQLRSVCFGCDLRGTVFMHGAMQRRVFAPLVSAVVSLGHDALSRLRMSVISRKLKHIDMMAYVARRNELRKNHIHHMYGTDVDDSVVFTNHSLIALFAGVSADGRASALISRLL